MAGPCHAESSGSTLVAEVEAVVSTGPPAVKQELLALPGTRARRSPFPLSSISESLAEDDGSTARPSPLAVDDVVNGCFKPRHELARTGTSTIHGMSVVASRAADCIVRGSLQGVARTSVDVCLRMSMAVFTPLLPQQVACVTTIAVSLRLPDAQTLFAL